MKKIIILLSTIWLIACNNQPDPKKDLLVGGVIVSSPSNGDTTITITTKDSVFKVSFKAKVTTTTETSATVTGTARVKPPVDTVKPPPVDTVVVPPSTTARANLMYESTFEGTNWLKNFNSYIQGVAGSVTQSNAFVKAGSSAVKFTLKKTDALVSSGPRSEITMATEANNVDRWYGMSFYLPADYIKDPQPESVIQWHHTNSNGSPPLALYTQNGQWVVDWIPTFEGKEESQSLGAYATGVWTDVVFHVKWSTTSSGLTEIWIGGKKVFTRSGRNAFDGQSNYLKLGVYKWPWKITTNSTTTVRTFYVDEFREGNEKATYKDVAP